MSRDIGCIDCFDIDDDIRERNRNYGGDGGASVIWNGFSLCVDHLERRRANSPKEL